MSQFPLTALATLAALAVYLIAGVLVSVARRNYKVVAPSVVGHPAFERAFRAQQNVLEWMPLFLPALWLFAIYWSDVWAAALGFVWALARLGYVLAYRAMAERRAPYFIIQLAAFLVLWFGALFGVARTLL